MNTRVVRRRVRPGVEDPLATSPVPAGGVDPVARRKAKVSARRLSRLTAVTGLVTLVSALLPAAHGRMRLLMNIVPDAAPQGAAAAAAAAGVLLLLLAHGLARRKRRAWQGTVVLLAISAVLHLVKGIDLEEATASLTVLLLMLWRRRAFMASPDPRSRYVSLVALVGLAGFDLTVGTLLIKTAHRTVGDPHGVSALMSTVVRTMLGLPGPVTLVGRRGETISYLLVAFAVLTVGVPAYLALRPARPAPAMSADDAARVRAVVTQTGGNDSLAYFALRPDKSVIWSATGKSAVTYRVVAGVMLASGDPLGDPEAWPGALDAFIERADRHGWVPAVLGCGEVAARTWARAGMSALELGDEAIVEVDGFTLAGRSMRNVRQAVRRVERLGYAADVIPTRDLTAARRAELAHQSDSWRGEVTERGFSMALGRVADPGDDGTVVVLAHDEHNRLVGLLQFVPWGSAGWSLDVMRRDPSAGNGVSELMITTALNEAPKYGVRRISLNFAVFRSTLERGERLGASVFAVTPRRILTMGSRWWQIESLYRFNLKFQPRWYTRYLCYSSRADLPRVVLSALLAEALVHPPRRLARAMRPVLNLPRSRR